ncbi:BBT_HP_G0054530.mRNA.1.CDS.1 [Saccharomyces cerevisiae]|nr:BBT_HP_G0054530.mRNA.1.CDS.1 [Saccharomyces cerevisiae]CAI6703130.1 BBT_HP_G0054530.mRNA.1.CDS.1 [Saccharomyces cerevisiae]
MANLLAGGILLLAIAMYASLCYLLKRYASMVHMDCIFESCATLGNDYVRGRDYLKSGLKYTLAPSRVEKFPVLSLGFCVSSYFALFTSSGIYHASVY